MGTKFQIPFLKSRNIKITQQFIQEIHSATLDNGGLNPSVVEHLEFQKKNWLIYLILTFNYLLTSTWLSPMHLRQHIKAAAMLFFTITQNLQFSPTTLWKKLVFRYQWGLYQCLMTCVSIPAMLLLVLFAYLDTCSICRAPQYDPHQLLLRKNVRPIQ